MTANGVAPADKYQSSVLEQVFDDLRKVFNFAVIKNTDGDKSKRFENGATLFSSVPKDDIVDFYEALIAYLPQYYERYPHLKLEPKSGYIPLDVALSECFIDYLNSAWSRRKCPPPRQSQHEEALTDQAFETTEAEAREAHWWLIKRVLHVIIPMEFATQEKYWRHVFVMLRLKSYESEFVNFVSEKASKGEASSAVMHFCIKNEYLCKFVKGLKFVVHACLLGSVTGYSLETFFKSRSGEDRRQGRALLQHMEVMEKPDYVEFLHEFTEFKKVVADDSEVQIEERFQKFKGNITDAMRLLRCQPPLCNTIEISWAMRVLKDFTKKFYEKTTSREQLYDVIYNVLSQRPNLKKRVVTTFRQYKDEEEAILWHNMRIVPRVYQVRRVPLEFPQRIADVHDPFDDPNYLSIPLSTKVTVVNDVKNLHMALEALKTAAESSFPFAGLDAEWSAYVPYAKASVLQVALLHDIFLFDLDSFSRDQSSRLFEALFANPRLIKVGFSFGEDLIKLRKVVPKEESLYAPKSLICISSIVAMIAAHGATKGENVLTKLTFEIEKDADATEPHPSFKTINNKLKTFGLAKLVSHFLEMELDKSEQCSVWDRRPLRTAQIRYGALDVLCLIRMVQKCLSYAEKWNFDLMQSITTHYMSPTVMPLFLSADCDPSIYPPVVIADVIRQLVEEEY